MAGQVERAGFHGSDQRRPAHFSVSEGGLVGNPKLESLLDGLLLGDTSMRHGNFKAPLNRSADPRIESGEIRLGCLHTCNLARIATYWYNSALKNSLNVRYLCALYGEAYRDNDIP